jgi:hypothetical protein
MSPDTQYKTEISIGYGELKPVIEWCQRNCANDWGYNCLEFAGGSDGGLYDFYFETESDYINFILWKK